VVAVRFAGSAILICAFHVATRRVDVPSRRSMLILALMGALTAGVAFLFFASLHRIPASTASLVVYRGSRNPIGA
jgi:drug/metabolite transporter (DMT)-like permease